ncbi:DMT family transporter [Dietzia cinnamea]|uniref:DMT family transporter n=1 Tax=Dietzia cinnamea TaxID=321318 RepID=A0ABV3YHF3_9ACTN|nr:DMT family transporter [Dietzia cinnamea]MCT2139964.1 DMT family transporter [Dietzia cinnamea]
MTETWAAVLLALASALSQAFGTVMRHRSPRRAQGRREGDFHILTSRYWWTGMAISLAGFVFQGLALIYGSLILVQTITVLSLTFALPLGAWVTGRRVTKTELFWGHVLAGCVVVLVIYGRPTGGEAHPPWWQWALACAAGALVVVVLLRLSRALRADGNRALLLGVAGGTAFAYVALLTKGVADRFYEGGPLLVATTGEVYGLVVAAVLALTLQQMSFSAGGVHQAVPASTVTTPVVSLALGVVVLGEWFAVDGPELSILAATLIVMVVATVRLAHKEVDPAPSVDGSVNGSGASADTSEAASGTPPGTAAETPSGTPSVIPPDTRPEPPSR